MEAIKSRKLWLSVLGAVGVNVAGFEGAPWYVIAAIALIVAAYSLGQGIADKGKEAARILAKSVKAPDPDKVIAVARSVLERKSDPAPEPEVEIKADRTAETIPATKDEL